VSANNDGSSSMRVFGATVRALREQHEISVQQLADHVGYSKSLDIKIERGERTRRRTSC
jgi:transcriptional regulator with XRE-family HTH domain